jgi:methyltransferase-like protein 6
MEENAKKIIDENPETLDENYLKEHLDVQNKNWEKFYKFNKTNFFKDRHYILKEFSELKDDERVRHRHSL